MRRGLIILAIVAVFGLPKTAGDAATQNPSAECCTTMTDNTKIDSLTAQAAPSLVCTLTSSEMRERRAAVLELLSKRAIRAEETAEGYTVTFENGSGRELVEFIELERQCCSFFTFTLTYGPNAAEPVLTINGPEGSKAFLGPTINSWINKHNPEKKLSYPISRNQ